jgi:hypothetical protein
MSDATPAEAPTSAIELSAPYMSLQGAARFLRTSEAEILTRVGRRDMLAVKFAHGLSLPMAQFRARAVIPRLRDVLDALSESLGEDPLAWAAWLGTPAQWAHSRWDELADGDAPAVVEAARTAVVTWELDDVAADELNDD